MALHSKPRENTTHQSPLIRVKPFGIQGLSLTATSLTSVSFAESFSVSGSTPGARSITPSALTIGVGQLASRSIGIGPAVPTIAGIGAEAAPRDRERVVVEPDLAG